ncbi:MAG: alkylmercury lyase [Acidimicrobiales bacterium]
MSSAPTTAVDFDETSIAEPVLHVELLHVPDCPLVDSVRALLQRCILRSGLHVFVENLEGPYSSPTLLVNGGDVTGRPTAEQPSCRLDLPTEEEILTSLTAASLIAPDPERAEPCT